MAPGRLLVVQGAGLDGVLSFDRTRPPSLDMNQALCYDRDQVVGRSEDLFVGSQSCRPEKFSVGSQDRHLVRKIVEQSEHDGLGRFDVLVVVDALLNCAHAADAANNDDAAAAAAAVVNAPKVVGADELWRCPERSSADSQTRNFAGDQVVAGMGDVGVDSGKAAHPVADLMVVAR